MAAEGSLVLTPGALQTPFAEAFRALRANLSVNVGEAGVRSLLVTSGGVGEGKSTTAANLAILMAQAGRRVILVDADFRRPSLSRMFPTSHKFLPPQFSPPPLAGEGQGGGQVGRPEPLGLADLVLQTALYAQACQPVPGIDNLYLVPTGAIPSNPAELLASARMRATIANLTEHADVVLLDSPPCSLYADAVELTRVADGLLYVVRAGPQGTHDHQRILKQLQRSRARLIGVVMNQVDGVIGNYRYRRPDGHHDG
jgi:Mrp family chromosome partitioning ATPase